MRAVFLRIGPGLSGTPLKSMTRGAGYYHNAARRAAVGSFLVCQIELILMDTPIAKCPR